MIRFFLGVFLTLVSTATSATPSDSEVCDAAARRAALDANIPSNVILAIARLESGRRIQGALTPWPWTVNNAGQGQYFETRDQLLRHLMATIKTGEQNFDVGCFQINYRWHGNAFASLDAMADPWQSARYAARFLADLFEETGDWTTAVGAYHSRTPEHAKRYKAKYVTVSRDLPSAPAEPTANQRQNGFRLLAGGSGNAVASLVPVDSGSVGHLWSR